MRRWPVVLALLTAACGGGGGEGIDVGDARPLSAGQAEALALVRSEVLTLGTVDWELEIAGTTGFTGTVTVDYTRPAGHGTLTAVEDAAEIELAWDLATLAQRGSGTSDWNVRPLSPASALDRFLALVLMLGHDSIEVPQLLRQGTARYLGDEEVAGQRAEVFSGPLEDSAPVPDNPAAEARTRYWISPEGQLLRFAAWVNPATGWDRATFVARGTGLPGEIVRLLGGGPG